MKAAFNLSIILLLAAVFAACNPVSLEKDVSRSFYYWKTYFSLDEDDYARFDSLKITRLYIRFFDVLYDEVSQPTATIQWRSDPPEGIEVVPVVFITTDVIRHEPDITALARHITEKIDRLRENINNPIPEVQIDCDWTTTTKDRFFELLQLIRNHYAEEDIKLSSTQSLHQVKHAHITGVPPVDRGMLMFYNTGRIQHYETSNSILDLDTAAAYLANFENYPIPIDAALPVFSWGIVFRDGNVHDIIHNLGRSKVENTELFLEYTPGYFKSQSNGIFHGRYFLKNDVIRVEEVSDKTVVQGGKMLSENISNSQLFVSLYHWDNEFLKNYDNETLLEFYKSLH